MRASTSLLVLLGLAAAPRAAAAYDAIGVNAHVPDADVVDLVADLGAKWMRVDNDWYVQGDPCGAGITWLPPLDAAVTHAATRGVGVFMTLAYTPACGSSGGADGIALNDVPDPAAYGAYVRRAVAHYRALGVTHFGLWNEPNVSGFFEGSAAAYVANVVVPGLAAVDAGCADAGFADCKALGPDVAHVGDYDVFLEDVLADLIARGAMFDILAHHIYQDFETTIFEGDSFLNALEMRRFDFTRRSFLDVLGAVGLAPGGTPSVEVWITETGWRAQPPTDATQMTHQRDHVVRVADEQLLRPWWRVSFFYEIVDSMDSLDGFGITRRDGSGGFVEKPAYTALQAKIAGDPLLQGQDDPSDPDPDAGPSTGAPDAGPGDADPDGGIAIDGEDERGGGCAAGGRPIEALGLLIVMAMTHCVRRNRRRRSR